MSIPTESICLRSVTQLVPGTAVSDGAGVRLLRTVGTHALPMVDPFLMLDEFRSDDAKDYIAGFPDHPHRGFETVTVMLAGRMQHKDSVGNHGDLGPGSVQWMTAGRGIIHSEMPQQENGLMWGFQLWVNLPAADKMTAPRYQDIAAEQIPSINPAEGVTIRVIAGEVQGTRGPIQGGHTAPRLLDMRLAGGAIWDQPMGEDYAAFVYGYEGEVRIADGEQVTAVPRGHAAVLGPGNAVRLTANNSGRCLLIAGRPIKEPVARYGPFVMNTREQLEQAVLDFRAGRFVG